MVKLCILANEILQCLLRDVVEELSISEQTHAREGRRGIRRSTGRNRLKLAREVKLDSGPDIRGSRSNVGVSPFVEVSIRILTVLSDPGLSDVIHPLTVACDADKAVETGMWLPGR